MKFNLGTLILLVFSPFFSLAQNSYAIKGSVVDTVEKMNLTDATICVLNCKDSILTAFTRSQENGNFNIKNVPIGKFILMVTYPGYADYIEQFNIDPIHKEYDFRRIKMILRVNLLNEVIVKGTRAAITIKGDTTIYDPRSFKIKLNASVEDLLKQLPGIQVDQNGHITAQGQVVNRVLVDGEEFFGDDPTLVTKNLRADMVDKVQLYDKKTDQATLTGIDDGKKAKTINIKLKEDKKNGYFGKVNLGEATNDFYQGQGMINKFTSKTKLSAFATFGNTGKTGLGWKDSQKYGYSDNSQFSDDGNGIIIFGGGGDQLDAWNGKYDGRGVPLTRAGGLHFDEKFNNNKQSLNLNYKIGSLEVKGIDNTLTQNNEPLRTVNNTTDQNFDNFIFRQKLDGTFVLNLDTSSNLKFNFDGTLKTLKAQNTFVSAASQPDGSILNNNQRSLHDNGDDHIFDISALYSKKFRKKGRTLSFFISESLNEKTHQGIFKIK